MFHLSLFPYQAIFVCGEWFTNCPGHRKWIDPLKGIQGCSLCGIQLSLQETLPKSVSAVVKN